MRTIAVVAQKGGQLKTTSVVNLAACLAEQGRRVLVVDLDVQANATHVLLRGQTPRKPTISEVLTGEATIDEAIVPSGIDGVEMIPSEPALADVGVALAAEVGRERRLRSAMAEMTQTFDVCLIDTGPTRSLLTTNVLNFAAEVLVPISPGAFGFLGLNQLQADMAMVRRFLENKSLALLGIVLVMIERTSVSRDFERQMRELYADLIFKATIPRAVAFEEANARTQTIFEHAPKSPGALAYKALMKEVLNRGKRIKEKRNDPAHGDLSADDAA